MKSILLLLCVPLSVFSQDISGVWTGILYNDTTRQSLQYELAISETNGKYTAYSYTTFIIDNAQLVGVKSIKVFKKKDEFFFEDDALLYNNYPISPPKGVKQVSALTLSMQGDLPMLTGKFITTRTRQYGRQVTGTIQLEKRRNTDTTKLMASLDRLGMAGTLAFVKNKHLDTPNIAAAKDNTKNTLFIPPVKVEIQKQPDPMREIEKRKVETIQTINFTSDSLQLTLYDNGYVDGDSVSLIMNGKILLQHQRLSTKPIVTTLKTIRGSVDSINLIMFAENLGTIAPNTGLLIIQDGTKRYEVTFSGDLYRNAAVLLKRRIQ